MELGEADEASMEGKAQADHGDGYVSDRFLHRDTEGVKTYGCRSRQRRSRTVDDDLRLPVVALLADRERVAAGDIRISLLLEGLQSELSAEADSLDDEADG